MDDSNSFDLSRTNSDFEDSFSCDRSAAKKTKIEEDTEVSNKKFSELGSTQFFCEKGGQATIGTLYPSPFSTKKTHRAK